MKQLIIILLLIESSIHLNAQTNDSIIKIKMANAWQLLNDSKKQPTKAFELFTECANLGNPEAMNALGVQYKMGLGVLKDANKAIDWFSKAANSGYIKAWYNLGMGYKDAQDFENAYQSFSKASSLGDQQSAYARGYMLYKGLGCEQDYSQAVKLFSNGAYIGKPNSMYFYGLCLRNGYGIATNIDSARYWLMLSASLGYKMASDELMLKEPENVKIAGELARKIKGAEASMTVTGVANKYQKVLNRVDASEVSGIYTGYLLKYDWSGQHIIEANKLTVKLEYDKDSLKGAWNEDDSLTVPIHALLSHNSVIFNQMQYRKTNHYSPYKPELSVFKQANLKLEKVGDSVYLSGNIVESIPNRNEPAKPLFLALVRTKFGSKNEMANSSSPVRAYPNPFRNTINIDFELTEDCNVSAELLAIDGKIVYNNPAGRLTRGSYTLPIQTSEIEHGYYTLVLHYGNKIRTAKVVKL